MPFGCLTAAIGLFALVVLWRAVKVEATPIDGVVNPSTSFYVAPYGADTNPGSLTEPFLTIQHCASTAASGATCFVRAGTYYETVTPNSGITITAYQNESATVDGTVAVGGWNNYSGYIYAAHVSLSAGDSNQIFINHDMMTEARWPNGDDLFHPQWATAKDGTTPTQLVDASIPTGNWTNAHIHFWSGSDPWDPQTAVVTSSAPGNLGFTVDGASFQPFIVPQSGGYYYLFGALAALDSPREWSYDASSGTLYLYSPGGVDPNTLSVRAKVRQNGFDLSGKTNVVIDGLQLFACSINTDAASSGNTIRGITAKYVSHFTTLPEYDSRYPHSYWYTHLYDSGIVVNGTYNSVINSSISYSAGNGITVFGIGHTIKNNLIHHVDYIGNYGSGISIQGSGHTIQYNTVYATARFGIFPNAIRSGSGPDNTDISYNDISRSMMFSRDGAAIYVGGLPAVSGSAIHHNRIHDIQTIYGGPASDYALAGVYLDEDSSGWQVYQNVIWNTAYYGIFLHGSSFGATDPNNNNVHNNSIPDAAPKSYVWLQDVTACGTTQVVHNYVLVGVVATNSPCIISDNGSSSAGATDMTTGVAVGCNLAGCSPGVSPTVTAGAVAPSIAYQPSDLTVPAGQSAMFVSIANGSDPLAYQWQRNGVNIAGATTSTYQLATTAAADSGSRFAVTVNNSLGSITSTAATLKVMTPPGRPPLTDDPLTPTVTVVRAVHVTELRTRVDAVRQRCGLSAFAWTDPSLNAGATLIRSAHISELRTALSQAYTACHLPAPTYADQPPLGAGLPISVKHLTELRSLLLAIE